MLLSLTVTPMMCARILRPRGEAKGLRAAGDRVFARVLARYRTSLVWALRHRVLVLLALLATFVLNVVLVLRLPKGFFPVQDTGVVFGALRGPQDASFETMDRSTKAIVDVIRRDPAVEHVAAFTGVGATNTGNIFLALKPLGERGVSAAEVIGRLRGPLAQLPVASVYLQPSQDVRVGGRMGFAQYQYTLQADSLAELTTWGPRLLAGMRQLPGLLDVSSDQQNGGLQSYLSIDRAAAARVGLTVEEIDSNLASAFGQSLASVIYGDRNQYYVVLEAAARFTQRPTDIDKIYFQSNGQPTPISTFASWKLGTTPLQVSHTGLFPSVTVSFNLAPGLAVGDATERVEAMQAQFGMPAAIRGAFSGTLEAFKESLASEPLLVLTALLAVYLVLGILYESLIHPLTILSTLPSASVGAMLALLVFGAELDVVAVIGIVLLIGIVKKNAIMMIDFALAAERDRGMTPYAAIFDACMLRFRPILMTTLAALFGALPLAFGTGLGAELRRPLGITIIGGLIVSQLLTLYTTPVIYLYLDRFRRRRR
jgi:multidrug efflux pump